MSVRLAPVWTTKKGTCEGEVYPSTLDSLRYLRSSSVLNYFAVFRFPTLKDRNDVYVLLCMLLLRTSECLIFTAASYHLLTAAYSFTNLTTLPDDTTTMHVYMAPPNTVQVQGILHKLDAQDRRTVVAHLDGGLVRPHCVYYLAVSASLWLLCLFLVKAVVICVADTLLSH
jgi:hypothetical protein